MIIHTTTCRRRNQRSQEGLVLNETQLRLNQAKMSAIGMSMIAASTSRRFTSTPRYRCLRYHAIAARRMFLP